MNGRMHILSGLAALWLIMGLAGCATAPETGRKQLMLISPQEEIQLGLTAFEKMKQEVPISKDPKINSMVQRVGERIARVSGMENAQWEFVVFESPEANAFCLPGGKVGVYTGILPITKNEGGLATVIGHEVAHALLRHGAERLSEALLIQSGGQLLGSLVSNTDPAVQSAVVTVYGLGTQLGRELPHSRAQESEADHVGLRLMARAGYDPREAIAFWERFAEYNAASSNGTPWFLRTHPLDMKRIEDLKRWLPEAEAEYRRATQR